MSNGTEVFVTRAANQVQLRMARERAELLFHDVNRLLSLLDVVCPNLQDGRGPDTGDQAAYDRTNEVLAQLQRELQIEPEGT